MTSKEFEEKYASLLNQQQKDAVYAKEQHILILAVPGGGKTTMLITRLGHMIYCRGIPPHHILSISYTRDATAEIKERFALKFNEEELNNVEFRTINGICSLIIQYYSNNFSKKEPFKLITSEYEINHVLRPIYQKYHEDFPTSQILKNIKSMISYCKNVELKSNEIDEKFSEDSPTLIHIYNDYKNVMLEKHWMDFDDQMVYSLGIFNKHPEVLAHFQKKYPYICVDESQDTSKIQHSIIRLLVGDTGNLFMVGDEDQSIYAFRAAYPQALMNFEKEYPDCKILFMEENYRSTQSIVKVVKDFVSRNTNRYEKTIVPTQEFGVPASTIHVKSRIDQYRYMFSLLQQSKGEEIGVLFRNNATIVPLIDLLERENISYNCKQNDNIFFLNRITLDVIDILNFIENPNNSVLFERFYFKLQAYIKKDVVIKASRDSDSKKIPILDVLKKSSDVSSKSKEFIKKFSNLIRDGKNLPVIDILGIIWNDLNYSFFVEKECLDENIFDILLMLGNQIAEIPEFLQKLEYLDNLIKNHVNHSENTFSLSTIHSCKGLEYESVYILDIFDGILPVLNEADLNQQKPSPQKEELLEIYQEERRLFYVAMTRAKKYLNLFHISDLKSSFVKEAMSYNFEIKEEKNELICNFPNDMIGKMFHDKELGQGEVVGEGNFNYLIHFEEDRYLFLKFPDLIQRIDYSKMIQKPKSNPKDTTTPVNLDNLPAFITNDPIEHKTFGKGYILSIENQYAEIRFYKHQDIKKIDLEVAAKSGFLIL